MAQIYRFPNALARKVLQYRALACLCLLFAVCGWLFWGFSLYRGFQSGAAPVVLWPLAALVCLTLCMALCARVLQRKARIFASGARGEAETARILAKLPDAYCIAVNTRFFHAGRDTELDFVVAGPHGVTVVEAKHHGGRITGAAAAPRLCQTKKGGAHYEESIANPLLQTAVQVRHLERLLAARGCPVQMREPVRGVVYFSNPTARVALTGSHEIAVLCAGTDDLCTFLRKSGKNEKAVTPTARAGVMRALREK